MCVEKSVPNCCQLESGCTSLLAYDSGSTQQGYTYVRSLSSIIHCPDLTEQYCFGKCNLPNRVRITYTENHAPKPPQTSRRKPTRFPYTTRTWKAGSVFNLKRRSSLPPKGRDRQTRPSHNMQGTHTRHTARGAQTVSPTRRSCKARSCRFPHPAYVVTKDDNISSQWERSEKAGCLYR